MVGIVLLNYNTPEDVATCVDSIREKTEIEYKIYIVDNASKDSSYEIFTEKYANDDDIILMRSDVNGGFSAGNNIGIKRAIEDKCKYICLINADILLINDAIKVLCEKMDADETIGVSAPLIEVPNQDVEAQFARNKLTVGNYMAEKTFFGRFKRFARKHPRYQVENSDFTEDYKFFGMTYGCMYIARADFFEKTGMLDDSVFLFNEEDIVAYKLESENLYTLITPDAKVFHNHHSSISKTSVANRIYHLRISPLIVLRKYGRMNGFMLVSFAFVNSLSWMLKSVRHSDFRKLLFKFIRNSFGTLKIKKLKKPSKAKKGE